MRKYLISIRYVFIAGLLWSACLPLAIQPAIAAPFCVETQGAPAECWYYDVQNCRKEAGKKLGHCSVNLKEIEVSGKGAPYCIIDSAVKPWCVFQNEKSCESEAARNSAAICFQNTMYENNDAYRFDRIRERQK